MAAQQILPPGTTLGRYRVTRPLGIGGMGTVYEGVHTDLDKRVAVKVLHDEASSDPVSRERFLQEGQTAAKIHHPHVVEIFDVGQDDGRLYLVMEYLDGECLWDYLAARGRLEVTALVDLMLPVCAALVSAHELGVVHRDLKPDNIFLSRSRHGAMQPKLLDFGISKGTRRRARPLTAEHALGTPEYMPPEQVRDTAGVDARADQYALAVVLYECATGRRPFEAPDVQAVLQAIQVGSFPKLRSLVSTIPEGFEAAVLRALSLDPDGRFPTMIEFSKALLPFASSAVRDTWAPVLDRGSVASHGPVAAQPEAPREVAFDAPTVVLPDSVTAERARIVSSRGPWPWVALACVVAIGLAVGAFANRSLVPTTQVSAEPAAPTSAPPPSASAAPALVQRVQPAQPVQPTTRAEADTPSSVSSRRGRSHGAPTRVRHGSTRAPRIVVDRGTNRAPIVE